MRALPRNIRSHSEGSFKGYGWLTDNGMTWEDYWAVFRKYRHALYITNVSKEKPERFTELNYQFLTTVSVRADEFRPADLPDGWDHSPEEDGRDWLTKQTELTYYNFKANREFRRDYFLRALEEHHFWERKKSREYYMAAALKKNPHFIAEPTFAQRLDNFFDSVDWSEVDSNVERLPYLARQLKKHTPKIRDKPAADSELFTFAQQENWKAGLDPIILAQVSVLLEDYEAALSRIRACRVPIREKPRKRDIDRILYARGQEDRWDAEELYAQLQDLDAERVSRIRRAMAEEQWHFMDEDERERFLVTWLPMYADLHDLLADFCFGGYRVLSDLICDIDDENTARERKQLIRDGDSPAFVSLMEAYRNKSNAQTYREAVSARCRELLDGIVKPVTAVRYVVALGKRDLLWDLLPDAVPPNVLEVRHGK